MSQPPTPTSALEEARRLLRGEADIAFRRRAVTIVEYLDPRPKDRILDAGCGLGFYLALLSRTAHSRLVGVELSAERLRDAVGDPEVFAAFCLGDVTVLPFADAAFDKMILSEVLEHLPDDLAALREARRVLRPGGVLAITVPNSGYPFLWDPLNYVRERLGMGHFTREPWSGIWTDHRRLYAPAELVRVVRAAGLEPTDVHLETRYSFPFAHHVVYVIGRLLVERGVVGAKDGLPAKRWSFWGQESGSPLLRAAVRIFTAPDRYNNPRYESGPAVSLCLRAVRPDEP